MARKSDKSDSEDSFLCPHCQHLIDLKEKHIHLLDSEFIQEIIIKCPNCGSSYHLGRNNNKKAQLTEQEQQKEEMESQSSDNFLYKIPPYILSILFGSIFILFGILMLYNSLIENLKIGITFIGVGGIFIYLISEKKRVRKKLLISEKVTMIFSFWLILCFIITYYTDITIFFIVFFIGFLVIKQMIESNLTEVLEFKLKIIVLAFFAGYMMLIINTVIPYFTG